MLLFIIFSISCTKKQSMFQKIPALEGAYKVRILYQMSNKNYDGAFQSANEVLEYNPKNKEILLQRGQLYLLKKDIPNCLKDYNNAIKVDAQYSDAYSKRAFLYSKLNRNEDALKDYNTAISFNANDADLYRDRANFLCKIQKYDDAFNDYNKAVNLQSEEGSILFYERGECYEMDDLHNQAILDYTKAIEISEKSFKKSTDCVSRPVAGVSDAFCPVNLKHANDELYNLYQKRGLLYKKIGKNSLSKKDIATSLKFKVTTKSHS